MDPKLYHQLWMHREMLLDEVRCNAYQEAILRSVKPGDFVLDVGAGSGVLSMMACRAGAQKVYAVERTITADLARQLIEINGMEDRIQVIQNDVEAISLPDKVDVILSEWMGGFGIDENLLAPVLAARDAWLKPGGKLLPERVEICLGLGWDKHLDRSLSFWIKKPYGIDFSLIADASSNELYNARHHVDHTEMYTEPALLWEIDVCTYHYAQAMRPFQQSITLNIQRKGRINALAAWFNAYFDQDVELSNAPDAPKTHWGRTVFPLGQAIDVEEGTQVSIDLTITPEDDNLCQNAWRIEMDGLPVRSFTGRQGCVASPGFH